jgi:hypothetical protein
VVWLGAEGAELVCCRLLRVVGGDESEAALDENLEAEVAATVGPFVVLFSQEGAREADDRAAVGEDADDVGAPADLAVEALVLRRPLLGAAHTRRKGSVRTCLTATAS